MTAALRLGIVGCGRVTQRCHLPSLRSSGSVRVVSVADADEARRERTAARYGIPHRYRGVAELLAGAPVDAVAVCVPFTAHEEVAVAALAAGRHVLVEKPLAASLAECDRIAAAAAGTGLTAAVGFNFRCHAAIREAQRLLEAGALGPLGLISTTFTDATLLGGDLPEWREPGDADSLFEKGVHHFDLWRLLGGGEVATVVALGSEDGRSSGVGVLGRLAGGTVCVSALTGRSGTGQDLVLCGERLRLDVRVRPPVRLRQVVAGRPRRRAADVLTGIAGRLRGPVSLIAAREADRVASYRAQWEAFARAVRGETPPPATLEDGRQATAVALAASESLAAGRPAAVAAPPRRQ